MTDRFMVPTTHRHCNMATHSVSSTYISRPAAVAQSWSGEEDKKSEECLRGMFLVEIAGHHSFISELMALLQVFS